MARRRYKGSGKIARKDLVKFAPLANIKEIRLKWHGHVVKAEDGHSKVDFKC